MQKIIAFDADDTLWVNEPLYQDVEAEFTALLSEHLPPEKTSQELFKTEMQNLSMYGYGAKGFMLSMIETAIRVSGGAAEAGAIARIIELGKSLMSQPVQLIEGVDAVIDRLSARYTLVVATKGDLVDQERKLAQSGLTDYFHHIEIMSDKREANYSRLLHHLDIGPERFTMIGNSVRSDIEPVLNLGGCAIHVPFHTTWQHEKTEGPKIENERFHQVEDIRQVLRIL